MAKNPETTEKILAIETSGRMFSLALAEKDRAAGSPVLKGDLFLDIGLRHSDVLKDASQWLMRQCGWDPRDLTRLAVSTGPGSFTGLRVGIAFARALAQTLEIPLTGIPSLELVASGFSAPPGRLVQVLIDSIGGDVFWGSFRTGKTGPVRPNKAVPLAEVLRFCENLSKTTLAGEGALRYREEIRRRLGKKAEFPPREQNYPRASVLAVLALSGKVKISRSRKGWEKVAPFYLRPPLVIERKNKK